MSKSDRDHWNTRYTQGPWTEDPSPWLVEQTHTLPVAGIALDIAGGTGRNALWFASRGWDVTIVDISDVALAIASSRAVASGTSISTTILDLATEPLPDGPWDVAMLFHYLDRDLVRRIRSVLRPGGLLIGALGTQTNLERNDRPAARYLLEDGELPGILEGFELIAYEEGWHDNKHDARFAARTPS